MNREQVLVWLLIVVAVTMLPAYFVDRSMARMRKEQAAMEEELLLLREKVTAVRGMEERLAEGTKAEAGFEQRLIGSNPFDDMHRELTAVAAKAGLQVTRLSLSGGKPVQGLPLLEYQATVDVTGSVDAFVEYIRLLEQHPLLIGIPDLKLDLPAPAPGQGGAAPSPFRKSISLQFYGKGPTR